MTDDRMNQMKLAVLPERGVVEVCGRDAAKLLQGLITNDIESLKTPPHALYAALLTPQGKLLFDFIMVRRDGGFLLDAPLSRTPDVVKRLTMYKLRAEVSITDVSDQWKIAAAWGSADAPNLSIAGSIVVADPRLAELGLRIFLPASALNSLKACVPESEYHLHRITCGVPECGRDYDSNDIFPHEAMLDQLRGVSFEKGCFVGQEIVSRMEHRGTARRRIVPVIAEIPLPGRGAEVRAGDVVIGTMGTSAGARGLALIRLDRAAEFREKAIPLTVEGAPVRIELPKWAKIKPTSEPQS
jgi:hypothetical protein